MTVTISKCQETLDEIYKFSELILSLGKPINDDRLEQFEKKLGLKLPIDFKYIITKHNSFSICGTEVLPIGEEFGSHSIESVHAFEHEEVQNPMFKEFLPFSPDGWGNHYCLDLSISKNGISPVVFWQHDYDYQNKNEVEICNSSFYAWINEVMIEWTLEDTNYDGSSKE